jgi:hypothetical protein
VTAESAWHVAYPDETIGQIVFVYRTFVHRRAAMATTRAAWRTLARNELDDNGATKLWSDGLLNEWLAEAIRDYARVFPLETTGSLTTVASQADYTLPIGLVELVRVEHPTNTFRVRQERTGGDWRRGAANVPLEDRIGSRYAYEIWGATLSLEPAPTASGESINLRYVARRTEPSADGDNLPVDDGDVELLTFYVGTRALFWIGTQEAKRQAYERTRGADATKLGREYRSMYEAGVAARRRQVAPHGRRLVLRDTEY